MRLVAQITITREIADDGDLVDRLETRDQDGDGIALTDALGMLRLAEHTLIDTAMSGGDA